MLHTKKLPCHCLLPLPDVRCLLFMVFFPTRWCRLGVFICFPEFNRNYPISSVPSRPPARPLSPYLHSQFLWRFHISPNTKSFLPLFPWPSRSSSTRIFLMKLLKIFPTSTSSCPGVPPSLLFPHFFFAFYSFLQDTTPLQYERHPSTRPPLWV